MHFIVLTAIPLPQDIATAINTVPVEDAASFAAKKLLLRSFGEKEAIIPPEVTPELIHMERWECLVDNYVADLLAPYDENATEISFLEFDDQTEAGRKAYEQDGIDCVRTPDGRIIPCDCYEFYRRYELYDGKVYRHHYGPLHHRKLTKKAKQYHGLPNYPFRKLYPSFDAFMKEQWGCGKEQKTGHYGYYFNPNGQWDWWQIGGRWPFRFLVKDACNTAVAGEVSGLFSEQPKRDAPEGYRWVAGARKADIAWDVMREVLCAQCAEQFRQYEEWFNTGEIPKEYAGRIKLVPDGVISWGDYLYRKGESLEHHLYSLGLSDQHLYPINAFACVDADGWNDEGWGASGTDEEACQAWYEAVTAFIAKQPDDTLLVSVDCHA